MKAKTKPIDSKKPEALPYTKDLTVLNRTLYMPAELNPKHGPKYCKFSQRSLFSAGVSERLVSSTNLAHCRLGLRALGAFASEIPMLGGAFKAFEEYW